MARRHKISGHGARKLFSRTAGNRHVHPKNGWSSQQGPGPMRGGIRL
jgi:hypothetical protein